MQVKTKPCREREKEVKRELKRAREVERERFCGRMPWWAEMGADHLPTQYAN